MMATPSPKSHFDDDYSDIFDDADVPVEMHPDCADIFDDGKRPGEPVEVDIADVICCDAAPSKEVSTADHGAEGQAPWPVGSFRAAGAFRQNVLLDDMTKMDMLFV